MKIVLIGPVYPYKGGISHYTGLMHKSLCKSHDVTTISYKMQYPKIMFRKEQRDYDNDTFRADGAQFLIHTANPLNWGKVAKRINEIAPDLVIVQWWHPYFSPCYNAMVKKLKHTRVLFVCHNVFPHERFPADRKLTRSVLSRGDYFIVHSEQDAQDLLSVKPDAKYEKTVHPTYNAFRIQGVTKEQARIKLGIGADEKILLFFGFIREYKGLKHLLTALPDIVARVPDCKLYVVGDFGGNREKYEELLQAPAVRDHIIVVDGYVPDKEIEPYFAACDLVVLPYESATQSGIVQIAYGFEKPVVTTDVGGLPEVVLDGKTGYVVPPKDPQQLAQAIVRFFEEGKAQAFEENVRAEAYRYDWDRMTETIERLTKQ